MINNKNKRDELKKLIEKSNDVYALVEYLDKYRYYKEDIDYLLHSFKNIETNCAYTLEYKDYWYFFEEYIRFLTIAMSNGYIENNKENRNKVEELIAKNIKREKCTLATYLYAANFYRNMYLGNIDEYIDKKYEIIQLYEKAALKGSNQAQKEKQNFLEKIESLKKQPTEKENKDNLIKLIDNESDFPALIDFMDNYHTENQDIEYILYNFKKIEDNSSHLLKKTYYWRFFAEYIRALCIAIDRNVIENNAENRCKVEALINKTTSQKDCPHVAYLYAARFYQYMYMRNIHGYRNTDTRAKIISLYETASFNGNIFAQNEKLKFLAQADTIIKKPNTEEKTSKVKTQQTTKKESKDDLIKLIDNKNDFPALIDFMDNYQTEKEDIEYILKSFQDIEKNYIHPEHPDFNVFVAKYIQALFIAIDRNVIENNTENRCKIETLINKSTKKEDCDSCVYLYAARFYELMYKRRMSEYLNKKDVIISYYDKAESLGSEDAKKEKKAFVNKFLNILKDKDKLKKLIDTNHDVKALTEYMDYYQYEKDDVEYILNSFTNIETYHVNLLSAPSYRKFFMEYIRALCIAIDRNVIENNQANREKVESIIKKAMEQEDCNSDVYIYAARFYKYMYFHSIEGYTDKKNEIILLYAQSSLRGSPWANREKNDFLKKIENNIEGKEQTTENFKQKLIDSINQKHDLKALINFMDNYQTEKEDIEYILKSFQDIEKNYMYPKHPNFSVFITEYIRMLYITMKNKVLENNQANREHAEKIIFIALNNPKNRHVAYLYTARFYELMYKQNIEEYLNKKDVIISYYDKAELLGSENAKKEKKAFLNRIGRNDIINTPGVIQHETISNFEPKLISADTDLMKLTSKLEKVSLPFTLLISGPAGTGKSYYLRYLAQKMGKKVIEKTAAELFSRYQGEPSKNVLNLFKDAENQNAAIIIDEIEVITSNRENSKSDNLWRADMTNTFLTCLEHSKVPFMATTNFISQIDKSILRRFIFKIKFDYLTPEQKNYAFKYNFNMEAPAELSKIGGLTNGDFAIVKKKAEILGMMENTQEILDMLREETAFKSAGHIMNTEEKINFDKNFINVEGNSLDLYVKKIKENKINNFSILLYGPSGTGKSLYLRHLAQELGYELIERRASDILSRWHGESEQNLANAFEEAKNRRAMLIFDEIDSFLSSKNNMMQVHNAQLVNEFLVQLENHPYPVCGTTNYLENMEQASLRRFKINAKFDYLHKDQYNYVYNKTFGVEPPKEINKFTKLTPAIFTLAAEKVSLEDAQKDEKRIFEIFSEEVKRCTGENIYQKEDQTYEKLFINKPDLYTNPITDNYDKVLTGFVKVITDKGYGSGFFITDNGFIITNKHVVQEQTIVKIKLFSGREIPGEVIRINNLDIALIKVSEENKVYPMPIKTEELGVGSTVFCLGNPKGHDQVLSKGCITRYTYVGAEKNPRIETDCVLNKGSSGGPLFDEFGNVIAVNVAGWTEEKGVPLGINLHVPINDALNALNIKINS